MFVIACSSRLLFSWSKPTRCKNPWTAKRTNSVSKAAARLRAWRLATGTAITISPRVLSDRGALKAYDAGNASTSVDLSTPRQRRLRRCMRVSPTSATLTRPPRTFRPQRALLNSRANESLCGEIRVRVRFEISMPKEAPIFSAGERLSHQLGHHAPVSPSGNARPQSCHNFAQVLG